MLCARQIVLPLQTYRVCILGQNRLDLHFTMMDNAFHRYNNRKRRPTVNPLGNILKVWRHNNAMHTEHSFGRVRSGEILVRAR